MNWKQISKQFPINKNYIWFNSAGISTQPKLVHKKFDNQLQKYYKRSYIKNKLNYTTIKQHIKIKLGKLLNCNANEVTLIHHTAEGMNFIAYGFPHQNAKILLLENEYPSNVYPWEDKYQIEFVPLGKNVQDFLNLVKKKITTQTKIISFSAVHWITGRVTPLEEIGKICKKHDILFVVDASQGLGHIPIDVQKFNIDFLVSSCWKWLLGPIGLGVFYISSKKLLEIKTVFKGSHSVINDEKYLPYKKEWKQNADRFIVSTASYFDWLYFLQSLNFLFSIGINKIQKRIYRLASFFIQQLKKNGFLILTDTKEYPTGIITTYHPKIKTNNIFKILFKRKIICSIQDNKIRFSVHIMNTKQQVSQTISVLQQIKN